MASIGVNTGIWALECTSEKYIKQTIYLKTKPLCKQMKLTRLCSNYQYTCLAHIQNFNVHFKIIITWFLIYT